MSKNQTPAHGQKIGPPPPITGLLTEFAIEAILASLFAHAFPAHKPTAKRLAKLITKAIK